MSAQTALRPPASTRTTSRRCRRYKALSGCSRRSGASSFSAPRGGHARFNELLRQIDGVSRRMLSATLRQLERDGLVERHVYARVPARVEYELSPVGRAPLVALGPLAGWGLEHQADMSRPGVTTTACSGGARRARTSRPAAAQRAVPSIV